MSRKAVMGSSGSSDPKEANRGGRPPARTKEEFAEALRASKGMKTIAARKLGVDADTVHAAVKRWPELEAVLAECRESALDLAEDKLIEHIDAGNVTALIFFLKCQGKLRGYIERSELTGPNGAPLIESAVPLTSLSLALRRQIAAELGAAEKAPK